MAKSKVMWIWFLGLWCVNGIVALRITSLDVPKSAWDPVKLNCKYDLENDTLYSVKWYKDQREFFRCLKDGTVQEFPLSDIKIYHTGRSQIGSCFFELTAITPKSGGEYTCEVSLDWPTFKIVAQSARLSIIEPSRIIQPEAATTEEIATLSVQQNSSGPRRFSSFLSIFVFVIYTFINK